MSREGNAEVALQERADIVSINLPTPPSDPMERVFMAAERGADVAVIEKMMDLVERQQNRAAAQEFKAARAKALADLPKIVRTASHEKFGKYEELSEILAKVRPVLAEHDLSVGFIPEQDGDRVTVHCVLAHKDGYEERATLSAPLDVSGSKNAVQSIGSTVTYLSRYTLKAMLGLAAAKDDDGAAHNVETISADQYQEMMALIGDDEKALAALESHAAKKGFEGLHVISVPYWQNAMRQLRQRGGEHAS